MIATETLQRARDGQLVINEGQMLVHNERFGASGAVTRRLAQIFFVFLA